MGESKLPLKERDQIIERVKAGEVEILWRELGYANRKNFVDALRNSCGFRMSELPVIPKPIEQKEPERIPYPDFKIKPFTIISKKRDKEDIDIKIADPHLGKITESYNLVIAQKRLDRYLDKVMRIIELHRPIGKAHISFLGDNVQGENIYQGSRIGETECGVWEQINDYAIPIFTRFILSIAQGVECVDIDAVNGNHGKYGREATLRANWDGFVYKGLEVALQNQRRITVNCPTTFYRLFNLNGFIHFIFHGDQVRTTSGIPLFALKRKLQEWYAYVKGFHYAYGGHFHSWGADQVNTFADYQLSPPLVTGDEWALQVVGRASNPVQLVCGMHPRQGRTWEYKIFCDDDYLPKPRIKGEV